MLVPAEAWQDTVFGLLLCRAGANGRRICCGYESNCQQLLKMEDRGVSQGYEGADPPNLPGQTVRSWDERFPYPAP